MNNTNKFDKYWLEISELTVHDAAFWTVVVSDPIAHMQQLESDDYYEQRYINHPGGLDAVLDKCTVFMSAITTGEIKKTKVIDDKGALDIYKTYILKADWIEWCGNHGYINVVNLFSPELKTPTKSINPSPSEDDLARLFDPVTVGALEKMFPAGEKWKSWAERAKRNDLLKAREGRAKFNPYKAAQWFLDQNIPGYDKARCNRTLVNNLPDRSKHLAHLLTGDFI